MAELNIGVKVESLAGDIREAIRLAPRIGADGIEINSVGGVLSADSLSKSARRELVGFIAKNSLRTCALRGDLGVEYADPSQTGFVVDRMRRIVDTSVDLGVSTVTTGIGAIPSEESLRQRATIIEALREIGNYALNYGCLLAVEAGNEEPCVLRTLADELGNGGVKVGFNPGLLMVSGFDPLLGVRNLGQYIIYSYASDAIVEGKDIQHVDPGEGQVDFESILAAMYEAGYHGFHTICCEGGIDVVSRTARCIQFLRQFHL